MTQAIELVFQISHLPPPLPPRASPETKHLRTQTCSRVPGCLSSPAVHGQTVSATEPPDARANQDRGVKFLLPVLYRVAKTKSPISGLVSPQTGIVSDCGTVKKLVCTRAHSEVGRAEVQASHMCGTSGKFIYGLFAPLQNRTFLLLKEKNLVLSTFSNQSSHGLLAPFVWHIYDRERCFFLLLFGESSFLFFRYRFHCLETTTRIRLSHKLGAINNRIGLAHN